MGSWIELDAYYPPGALTPAAAFLVALGHLAGATSAYAHAEAGELAAFWPRGLRGIAPDHDLIARVEHYLSSVPLDAFLTEACARLNTAQRHCLWLNLLDAGLRRTACPEELPYFTALLAGLGAPPEWVARHHLLLDQKNNLAIFPQ